MTKDDDLMFDLNLNPLFERIDVCDYDTVMNIASNLIGLSELVKAKEMSFKKGENVDMMYFIADSLVNFSDRLCDSEFSCYVKKKKPTPTTSQSARVDP